MTTSVGNNSVFRNKENYLEHPIPEAPVAPPGQQIPPAIGAAHAAWVKGKKEELKAMFSKQAEQELLQTVREFQTCNQEEGQSVSSYVLKMKGYIDNLDRLGHPIGQNLAVSLILVSLYKDYDSFMQNNNMNGMRKTVNELHAMLKLHEDTLPKKDANPALHAIRVGRVQKNQKNKPHKAAKGGSCWYQEPKFLIKMFPRRSEDEDSEYPFFEGDGSSSDEWRDYGMSSEDYEGPPVFDDDQNEVELMPVYDTAIEDVIEEEEGFVGKGGFGGEEDNIEDVVVVVNDLCSLMIQTFNNSKFKPP
uniref:Zinc finger, CCHC-type n=1 Tax=Tanacetum cinerariifolium TaxID=118510 RepID=A0A699HXN6_TANCI|nr:zinc finger, CCHC-type [Tanacetum cinerariifolium]